MSYNLLESDGIAGALLHDTNTHSECRGRRNIGSPTNEELERMTTEFKEFLIICRRQPALYHTLKQIAGERQISLLDLARLFNDEQRKFLILKNEESRILSEQLMGESYRSVSET